MWGHIPAFFLNATGKEGKKVLNSYFWSSLDGFLTILCTGEGSAAAPLSRKAFLCFHLASIKTIFFGIMQLSKSHRAHGTAYEERVSGLWNLFYELFHVAVLGPHRKRQSCSSLLTWRSDYIDLIGPYLMVKKKLFSWFCRKSLKWEGDILWLLNEKKGKGSPFRYSMKQEPNLSWLCQNCYWVKSQHRQPLVVFDSLKLGVFKMASNHRKRKQRRDGKTE